jgi:tetratricopeptide (TPR) repeat protein
MISTYRTLALVGAALLSVAPPASPPLHGQIPPPPADVTLPPTVRATTPALRLALLEERAELDPDRYQLLWETAREGAVFGASLLDADERKETFRRALAYAERAKAVAPEGVDGRYWLAVTSGLLAEEEGGRTKIRLAEQAWDESSWVLTVDPNHAGAHHLQGRLHAAVMRLNRVLRFLARSLLGGDALNEASWEKAEYHLARAAALAPEDAVNHLELGMAYRDLKRREEAREAFLRAASTPPRRPADHRHIDQALSMLSELSY